jgi:molybdenum cofactor guanylyltransferase
MTLGSCSQRDRCRPLAGEPPFAAVVLAGGQARRLGGADKPSILIGGRSLLGSVVGAAASAGAARVIVVGPPRPQILAGVASVTGAAGVAGRVPVEFTQEARPGGGPVPAVRAGLALVDEPWMLLLAADLPFLSESVLRALRAAADPAAVAGAVLIDGEGHPQWLTSYWHSASLRTALSRYQGTSLRGLFTGLDPLLLALEPAPGDPPYLLDCDTPEDIAAATHWAAHPPQGHLS